MLFGNSLVFLTKLRILGMACQHFEFLSQQFLVRQKIVINTMKVLALAISNGIVALSGGLMAQYQGYSDINMGRGAIVIGLAAVIIGEVFGNAVAGRRMNFMLRMIFVVLGGVIYYIVIGIVLWLKLNSNDLKLFTAITVAIALALPVFRQRMQARKLAREGERACSK